jgi:hypothetical protein
LEALNTPIAVLAVMGVVVALNGFLFFGYYLPRMTNSMAPASPQIERTPPSTTVERTRPINENIEQETTTSISEAPPSKAEAPSKARGSGEDSRDSAGGDQRTAPLNNGAGAQQYAPP